MQILEWVWNVLILRKKTKEEIIVMERLKSEWIEVAGWGKDVVEDRTQTSDIRGLRRTDKQTRGETKEQCRLKSGLSKKYKEREAEVTWSVEVGKHGERRTREKEGIKLKKMMWQWQEKRKINWRAGWKIIKGDVRKGKRMRREGNGRKRWM